MSFGFGFPIGSGNNDDDLYPKDIVNVDLCPNSFFGSHKFEPRYDLGPADFTPFETFKGSAHTMEKLRTKTYVRDVCTKCGKTIERGH